MNTEIIRNFCSTFSRMNVDDLMPFFTHDAIYHNMPGPAVQGSDAIRATITRFLASWTATEWVIINIAEAGDVVFAERVDNIDSNGKHLGLPVTGVFELRDGKIAAWRDYFDLATYQRALQ